MSWFVCAAGLRVRQFGMPSLLQPRLGAAGANGTPTDPGFKGAKQSDEDKDRCEQSCLRNETTAGKQEDDGNPAAGNTAIGVDVRFHP